MDDRVLVLRMKLAAALGLLSEVVSALDEAEAAEFNDRMTAAATAAAPVKRGRGRPRKEKV